MPSDYLLFIHAPYVLLKITVLVMAITLRNIPARGWFAAYAVLDLVTSFLSLSIKNDYRSDSYFLVHSISTAISAYSIFCLGIFFLALWCKSRLAMPINVVLFSFSGRLTRSVFWMILALQIYLGGTFSNLLINRFTFSYLDEASPISDWPLFAIVGIAAPFSMWVSLASQVKRWHDCNKSGWLVLLTFIPFVGALITIILGLLPGSREDNVYGRSPRLASGNESASQPVNRFDKDLADTASGF